MPAVARIDPKSVFSADEWSELTSRSTRAGSADGSFKKCEAMAACAINITKPAPTPCPDTSPMLIHSA